MCCNTAYPLSWDGLHTFNTYNTFANTTESVYIMHKANVIRWTKNKTKNRSNKQKTTTIVFVQLNFVDLHVHLSMITTYIFQNRDLIHIHHPTHTQYHYGCIAKLWRYNWIMYIYVYLYIWVRSRNCGCLVTWFCYQLIAKPGNKTATVSWPDPYIDVLLCAWVIIIKRRYNVYTNPYLTYINNVVALYVSETPFHSCASRRTGRWGVCSTKGWH